MKILGIDPGTATTGYGLINEDDAGDLQVIDYGVILTPPDHPMATRLLTIYNRLTELITLHRPDTGAVEKLFFQRNVTTAMTVGQARGVVLLCMAQRNIPVAEYTPLEVKQSVTGYGRAEKKQIQSMMQIIFRLPAIPTPDDAADALAVAVCHAYTHHLNDIINSSPAW